MAAIIMQGTLGDVSGLFYLILFHDIFFHNHSNLLLVTKVIDM